MRGDLHPVAFRLSCDLPITTHERNEWPADEELPGRNQPCAVIVNGKGYESFNDAKKALHIGSRKLHRWIKEGRAVKNGITKK